MAVLGISSATKVISVGLAEGENLLAELTVSGKEAFTEDLILYIEKLVNESGAKIEGIAVTVGPGAYSSLRGGLATAKTLAQTLNVKLAAISTLHALAYNLRDIDGTIASITDACQKDYNLALFTSNRRKIERITEDLVIHFDRIMEVFSEVRGRLFLTGQVNGIYERMLELNPKSKIQQAQINIVSGYNVALIGGEYIKEGKVSDPLTLIPRYSHKPNIREFT